MKKSIVCAALLLTLGMTCFSYGEETTEITEASELTDFLPTVLFDQAGITVTAVSENTTEYDEYQLNIEVENNTDNDITISLQNPCVNGWVCDPCWGTEITAQNRYIGSITWYDSYLEMIDCNPNDVTMIAAEVIVTNSDTWDTIAEDSFVLYPRGEAASSVIVREALDSDIVLLDNDGITVSVISFTPKTEWDESTLNFYIKNESDKNVLLSLDSVAVNDIMCDPYWGQSVPKGVQSYSIAAWYSSTLEEKGIENIETIEGSLLISDYNTYDILAEETIKLTVSDLLQE